LGVHYHLPSGHLFSVNNVFSGMKHPQREHR